MPVYIECSSCHRKLRVRTDLLGKSVRCPNCRAKFLAAPVDEGAPSTVETGAPAEGVSAVLATSPAVEDEDSSSGPTVRRPVPALPPETTPSADIPQEAIVASPPTRRAQREPTANPPAETTGTRETPWRQVSLVLGLVLLGLVLLGLLGALWITAGMPATKG